MLIDLEWINPDPEKFKNWDISNGGLSCSFVYGEEKYDHTVAQRLCKGIYHAYGLDNSITTFTKYKRVYRFEEDRKLWDYLANIQDKKSAEADTIRKKLLYRPSEYGRADDLKQIIRRGRSFLISSDPCVLEVHVYDNTEDKSYKQGEYIGNKKSPPEVIAYNWTFLRVKNEN